MTAISGKLWYAQRVVFHCGADFDPDHPGNIADHPAAYRINEMKQTTNWADIALILSN